MEAGFRNIKKSLFAFVEMDDIKRVCNLSAGGGGGGVQSLISLRMIVFKQGCRGANNE